MATAEFAVALPAVVIVLALVVAVVQLMLTQHRVWHAASVAARVAARGESDAAVRAAVGSCGVSGSTVVSRQGPWVSVAVASAPPRALSWALPDVGARVFAAQERGDEEAGP